MNLEDLRRVRKVVVGLRKQMLRRVYGMDIHPTVEMSLSANLDRRYPQGVHVAEHSYLALGSMLLTHDRTRGLYLDTRIERNCFIGARSVILPGVTIGEGSIVGAGAVVTKDVPPYCAVAGNPAKIIRQDLDTIEYGRLRSADAPKSA